MRTIEAKLIEWFLRLALGLGFLSAVADRFGIFWNKDVMVWGKWQNFVRYTHDLNPWIPGSLITLLSGVATGLEVLFGILLFTNYKTSLVAKGSGLLLLLFGLSMAFFLSPKAPMDYSVFAASAGAFALSLLTKNH